MFVLTKPEAMTTAAHISTEVERKLGPLAYDVEHDESGVTYRISPFSPFVRYSMFLPYSEVSFLRERGSWILRMKPTKLLLLPFAPFLFGLLVFRTVGPIDARGVLLMIAVPAVMVILAFSGAWLRVLGWWNKL